MMATEKKSHNYNPIEPPQPITLAISDELAGLRLDQALQRMLPEYSRSRLQQWIRQQRVHIAGGAAKPRQIVLGGESVKIFPETSPEQLPYAAECIALDIIFEDEVLLVINKPAGLVVHPGSGNWSGTMLNALLHHAPNLSDVPRAGIVHRLDKDTSGLLVVAKTIPAQTHLVRQLQQRTVKRHYYAIVHGVLRGKGKVEAPIGRDPKNRLKMGIVSSGKPATTYFETVESFSRHTLLQCELETGRTHQIRVHLLSLGHGLVGDPLYRSGTQAADPLRLAITDFGRQALHAVELALTHPSSNQIMRWRADLPSDMQQLLSALREHQNRG